MSTLSKTLPEIHLTEHEQKLRQLLLDVSDYIAKQPGQQKPVLRITGGWVRDKLLGIASKDIDIGISTMTGIQFGTMMKQFLDDSSQKDKYGQEAFGKLAKIEANPEKSKHLETVTTKVLGLEIDLVNLRKETYTSDSRNPTMEFGTAEEDAMRRDATVNALFYNLNDESVEDFTGKGLADMQTKIIRTPLAPYQTFIDDPLRVLRLIRFASKLDYSIDKEAENLMGNEDIKEALREKISRERIGIEVEKMLKGPHPRKALELIDRVGVFSTIFTDPTRPENFRADLLDWHKAYDLLEKILSDHPESKPTISTILLPSLQQQNTESTSISSDSTTSSQYLAWLLCAVVPFARTPLPEDLAKKKKQSPPVAALAAREGLKLDNKATDIVKNAATHLKEITSAKDAYILSTGKAPPRSTNSAVDLPSKRKSDALEVDNFDLLSEGGNASRAAIGLQLRAWGHTWKLSVLYALLTEAASPNSVESQPALLASYATWLQHLRQLDLMDAPTLRPLVSGTQIREAVAREKGDSAALPKPGPWLAKALEDVIWWQLAHPELTKQPDAESKLLSAIATRWKEKLGKH